MVGRRRAPEGVENVNASRLARKLSKRIEGEVRFDDGSRALYATDGSNYHQVPIGVVVPKRAEDVVETVALCREFGAPILSRGGGTSLAGQCCNVAVVMDMSKYFNRILEINKAGKFARVEPGVVLDRLRDHAKEQCGLTFGPDPSTHNHCTLGGMLGNNSCGVHSVMTQFYGPGSRTSDNVEELEIWKDFASFEIMLLRRWKSPPESTVMMPFIFAACSRRAPWMFCRPMPRAAGE